MRICVLGAGYVGLVSAACLSELGHEVTCIDIAQWKIAALSEGRMPIFEPGLEQVVGRNMAAGRLRFSTKVDEGVRTANVVFLALGTPGAVDGSADVGALLAAAGRIAPTLRADCVVVIKSTVPVGTGQQVSDAIRDRRASGKVQVVSNPEFLREGNALHDFLAPDRILVGTEQERAAQVMRRIYLPLTDRGVPLLVVDRRSAELAKYVANAFLAMKVSFANEIADLSETLGANAVDVLQAVGLDRRIGLSFLNPGPGYGGSCLPKDTRALAAQARDAGASLKLLDATIEVNERRKRAMVERVASAVGGTLRARTIAVLGLTFKAGTDDIRESPAIALVRGLQASGAEVRLFDPMGMAAGATELEGVSFAQDPYDCVTGSDALVIATEWEEFRRLDLLKLASVTSSPVMIDFRNIYDPELVHAAGFSYIYLGHKQVDLAEDTTAAAPIVGTLHRSTSGDHASEL